MKKVLLMLFFLLSLKCIAPQLDGNILTEHLTKIKKILQDDSFRQSNFTPQLLYEALVFNKIQNPDIVMKQSVVETGDFTSVLFLESNNPFGMHLPGLGRRTTASGFVYGDFYDNQFHKVAKFNCWYDAVLDYVYWQNYWLKEVLNESQYYTFLDTLPYAANLNYIAIVKAITLNIVIEEL